MNTTSYMNFALKDNTSNEEKINSPLCVVSTFCCGHSALYFSVASYYM